MVDRGIEYYKAAKIEAETALPDIISMKKGLEVLIARLQYEQKEGTDDFAKAHAYLAEVNEAIRNAETVIRIANQVLAGMN